MFKWKQTITSMCLAALTLVGAVNAVAGEASIRKSVFSLSPAEIEQYRKVVLAMKALPKDDPRNWEYQSGIHQHIEAAQIDGLPSDQFSQADKAEMKKYALTVVQHAAQNGTWDQCHQSDPDRLFLLWHRVYVYYFERIARKISNQPEFNLPYWDYTKGDVASRTLPISFREETYIPSGSNKPAPNPLLVVRRASINSGNPLDKSLVALDSLKQNNFELFGQELENLPHNVIHGALGKENSLLMGATVWAAQDPIFWLHHSNIDRLWSCWQKAGNTVPPQVDDGKKYPFINEDGIVVRHSIPEMQALVDSMNYKYETLGDCEAILQPLSPLTLKVTAKVDAFKSKSRVALGATPTTLTIKLKEPSNKILQNKSVLESSTPITASLNIQDIKTKAPLGVIYKVVVRRKGSIESGTTVGVIGFFGKSEGIFRSGGLHSAHAEHSSKPFSLSFDAGSALKRAISEAKGSPELEIIFIPSTGVEGEVFSSEKFNKAANPEIGKITLTISPPVGLLPDK